MLRKLFFYIPLRLFTTLVLLYISVGMHLLHPSFHEHLENDDHSLHNCHETLSEKLTVDENHLCPLCKFLALNHFFKNLSEPSYGGNQQYDQIPSTERLMIIKAYSKHIEPRASPYLSII